MRKRIWKVLKDLEKEKINTNEAYSQLCDLYSVVVPKGTLCGEETETIIDGCTCETGVCFLKHEH